MTLRTAIACLLALLTLCATTALAGEVPIVGGYGFDWLQPTTTACRKITAADRDRFQSCTFQASGHAFGLTSSYQVCNRSAHSQVLIYASPTLCQEAYDTMQSNGP
ncbi:hypothetical protein [Synechococcus sp. CS-1328]|uniref:hypothetical protein n=1 Tax=Synechococcus sp. CS-1328 TaxID=2847976 RepID=UPI00223C342F|nr:hypothetical protein [Synechococcus sp. CS-1328]MCT0224299.1 hypothetical protein [Synechococcus sp. CS-1328]